MSHRRPEFFNSGDDLIPRCAGNGKRPAWAQREVDVAPHVAFRMLQEQHPEFWRRVLDAVARLRNGEPRAAVLAIHGRIVVGAADEYYDNILTAKEPKA